MPERFPVTATPDRPEFAVAVAGAALDPAVAADVMEIDVVTEVDRHGRATLLVQNWDTTNEQVRHSDADLFAPGAAIRISLGYHSELTEVFDGVITSLKAVFGATGSPSMEVRCHTRSILLDAGPRSRWFEDATDEAAADAIAADYGLASDTGTGAESPVLGHRWSTDWEFLLRQGARLGWVTYVQGERLVHRPHASPGDTISLTWRTNLIELELAQDVSRGSSPVSVAAWDPAELDVVSSEATSGLAHGDRPGVDDAVEATRWSGRKATIATCRPFAAGLVDAIATSSAAAAERRHISGWGRCIGVPALRQDSWLTLDGIGTRFSGELYVTAVRHRLGTLGFHTEFQLGTPPTVLPTRGSARAASAPGGRERGALGLAIGLVDDLEDPEGQGRVKVSLPWQLDGPEAVWARLAVLDAGDRQGTWFVPDVGQEVVVGYLEDDPAFPVVLGCLWNGRQRPPESITKDNDIRAIVTRSGHQLRCDDGDKGTIALLTAGGHRVELADQDGSITIAHSNGAVTFTLGKDGATLEATSGDLTLSAPAGTVKIAAAKLDVSSSGPAKLASSATLDLSASATLSASGALVRLN